MNSRLSLSSALAIGLCSAAAAWAQESKPVAPADPKPAPSADDAATKAESSIALQQVVVTAERRRSTVQKTSISLTAITADDLADRAITSIDSAVTEAPGVAVQGGANGAGIYIRGIGSGQDVAIGGPAVNLNFDGVYQSQPEVPMSSLYDIERVEVLRGPQGTLYGRNANAGSVNILTADPRSKFEGSASLGLGNYNLRRAEAMVNMPVNETVSVRAAAYAERRDGYIQPSGYDDAHSQGARVKLLAKPNADLRVLLGADHLKIGGVGRGGVDALSTHPSDAWYSTAPTGLMDITSTRVYGQLDWTLGFGTLTVLPAHQSFRKDDYNVIINTPPAITAAGAQVAEKQDSLEVRLASPDASRVQWVAGAYLLKSTTDLAILPNRIALPSTPISYPYLKGNELSSSALFGQVTVPAGDSFRLIGGVRYTKDDKTAFKLPSAGAALIPTDGSWNSFTYKAGIEYDLAPKSLVYGNISTGFKAGGIDQGFNTYKPEKLTAFAFGSKNRFFEDRVQVNAEAFYYKYDDFQAQYGARCQNAAGCPLVFSFANTIVNAGKATLYGGEIELVARATQDDKFDASIAYLHSNFDQLVIVPGTANNSPSGCAATLTCTLLANQILTNQRLANAPEWSGSLGYEHVWSLTSGAEIILRADTHIYSPYWTVYRRPPQVSAESYQHSFAKSNAYVSYNAASGKWTTRLWVRNIENKAVVTAAVGPAVTLQAPRTVGATFSAKF